MLSPKLLNELKIIAREEFGVKLEPNVVAEVGNSFLKYFDLLAKISNREHIKQGRNHDKIKQS